jgi:hypothetical protein
VIDAQRFEGRQVRAVDAAHRLERHPEGGGPQARGQGHARVLLELDPLRLDRAAVPRGQAEVALHRHDAGARAGDAPGAAEDVDVVARRLLDDLEVALALPNQLAHEGEGAAVQEAAAQGHRRAVGHPRHHVGEGDDRGSGRRCRRHVCSPVTRPDQRWASGAGRS